MIRAAVIDNGIVGLKQCFLSSDKVDYNFLEVSEHFAPDLSPYDLLVVPNGSDQIALHRQREPIRNFLDAGKTLFCFDGWFTDWVPGNQWVMDNSKKTIDIRYTINRDRYQLFEGIDLDAFNFSNGISGWWACGYIQAAPNADVVLEDTWQRPIVVLDETTTPGRMLLTASAPLGDDSYATTDDPKSLNDLALFYHRLLDLLAVR
ncbi:MAG: hypothetical protein R3350_06810 [Saprospiraceae bacterium]|nr:hypothetical protein [Saprospiraceae bacterium]